MTSIIHHLGCSSGKDSSSLLLWAIHESGLPRESLRVTFCDTGNEDQLTYRHIGLLSEKVCEGNGLPPIEWLKPKRDFFELALHKKRFPSTCAQFCTQHLKLIPTQAWIAEREAEGFSIIAMSGKRASESHERRNTVEREFNSFFGCEQWNPLWNWSLQDVLNIHKRYGVPLNPLYAMGARRVGCFPCINSSKREIRLVAKHRPEKILQIAEWEKKVGAACKDQRPLSTFFASTVAPEAFRTYLYHRTRDGMEYRAAPIEEIVKWAQTSRGGKQFALDLEEPDACWIGYGACE